MNKTCDCHPFNLLREPGGSLTAYLSVNCFGKNLTQLPKISQYTWELNVSHNHIGNLAMLNSSLYNNLRRLDLSNNLVTNLKDLTNSGFVKKFDLLYINSNKFRKVKTLCQIEVARLYYSTNYYIFAWRLSRFLAIFLWKLKPPWARLIYK